MRGCRNGLRTTVKKNNYQSAGRGKGNRFRAANGKNKQILIVLQTLYFIFTPPENRA